MKTVKYFLLLLVFLIGVPTYAQEGIDSLRCHICKPWAITNHSKKKKVDPENAVMGNRITFYEDQTVYYTEGSIIREGRWVFDSDKNLIIIMDESFRNRVMALKIIEILPRQVKIQMPNEEGAYQTVYLRLIED